MADNKMAKYQGNTYVQWIITVVANTSLFSYGLLSGWTSPTTKLLQSESSPSGRPLTDQEISWIGSMLLIGAIAGVPLFAYIADTFGRKIGVIALAVPQVICWTIHACSAHPIAIIIARLFGGLSSGGCFNVVPMYIKEISQDNIRGQLGSVTTVMQNIGILWIYATGEYLDYYTVIWIALAMPVVTLILMLKAPESPAFLVMTGKFDEATKTVAWLRGLEENNKIVLEEISLMRNQDLYFKNLPKLSFLNILKDKACRRAFVMVMIVMMFRSINGTTAVLAYASTILSSSGVTISPELQTLSFPAIMIVGSFISMTIVEKTGRKPLLAGAFIVATFSLMSLGSMLLLQKIGYTIPNWLPVPTLIVVVLTFAAGISQIPFIVLSEIFHFPVRAKLMGCVVAFAWFCGFVQMYAFTAVKSAAGMYVTFYCFGGLNLLGAVATLVLMPETRGKTVEEIEKELLKVKK